MPDKIVVAMDFVRFIDGDKITQMLADGWQPLADSFTNQMEVTHEKYCPEGGHPYITFVKYARPVLVDYQLLTADCSDSLRDKILPLMAEGFVRLNEAVFTENVGFHQSWGKYEYPVGGSAPVFATAPKPTPPVEPICTDCNKKMADCTCEEIPF